MNNKLTAQIFDFFITTKCTMNCKLCAAAIPYVRQPEHTPKEKAFRELEGFFKVWDYAERIEFIGGEPLMHPELYDIVKESLRYSDQYGRLRITTNATIVPSDELCRLIAGCGKYFDFIIDDYGELSRNLGALTEKLDRYGIPYRVDVYHGKEQRFGGWIFFGDYTDRGHSEEMLQRTFQNCIAPKNGFYCVNDGKVFSCCYALSLYLVKGMLPQKDEYTDLFDDSVSTEEKKQTAGSFGKTSIDACRYCNGFNSGEGERFPGPPEQAARCSFRDQEGLDK